MRFEPGFPGRAGIEQEPFGQIEITLLPVIPFGAILRPREANEEKSTFEKQKSWIPYVIIISTWHILIGRSTFIEL
jgi:hypothetical protein